MFLQRTVPEPFNFEHREIVVPDFNLLHERSARHLSAKIVDNRIKNMRRPMTPFKFVCGTVPISELQAAQAEYELLSLKCTDMQLVEMGLKSKAFPTQWDVVCKLIARRLPRDNVPIHTLEKYGVPHPNTFSRPIQNDPEPPDTSEKRKLWKYTKKHSSELGDPPPYHHVGAGMVGAAARRHLNVF